jgi:hypothetical protein
MVVGHQLSYVAWYCHGLRHRLLFFGGVVAIVREQVDTLGLLIALFGHGVAGLDSGWLGQDPR